MKYYIVLFLLGVALIKLNSNNLQATTPAEVKNISGYENYYYDSKMLKQIEDSLKLIDPRSSITVQVGSRYACERIYFDAMIYAPVFEDDYKNISIGKNGKEKSRFTGDACKLAKIITKCAYNPLGVNVGIKYTDAIKDDEPFWGAMFYQNTQGLWYNPVPKVTRLL